MVLGQIFSYSDKFNVLLESIFKFIEMDNIDEFKNIDVLLGTVKFKSTIGIISFMIQFSVQTTLVRLKVYIMYKLIKKGKDIMGVFRGRKVLVFVDDLNMLVLEVYGVQFFLELLRQFLELGGFYYVGKIYFVWKVCDYWYVIDEVCNIIQIILQINVFVSLMIWKVIFFRIFMMFMWWQFVVFRGEVGILLVFDCLNILGKLLLISRYVLKKLD